MRPRKIDLNVMEPPGLRKCFNARADLVKLNYLLLVLTTNAFWIPEFWRYSSQIHQKIQFFTPTSSSNRLLSHTLQNPSQIPPESAPLSFKFQKKLQTWKDCHLIGPRYQSSKKRVENGQKHNFLYDIGVRKVIQISFNRCLTSFPKQNFRSFSDFLRLEELAVPKLVWIGERARNFAQFMAAHGQFEVYHDCVFDHNVVVLVHFVRGQDIYCQW